MSIKIKKSYSRNIIIGNCQSIRIGIDVEKTVADESEIEQTSMSLLKIGSKLVNKELRMLKEKLSNKSI